MKLAEITFDPELQSRVEISEDVVNEYAEAFKAGAKFPPIKIFFDGTNNYLSDGWQRCEAGKRAGLTEIDAEVVKGSRRDALLYSLKANATHGLRRTNLDKRKCVVTMLDDFEWAEWSDSEIARHCSVHPVTVGRIRKELNGDALKIVKVKRGDQEFTMKAREPQVKLQDTSEYEFDENDKIHEMATEIQAIAEENEILKARVAVAAMEATPEEKQSAETLISELQTTVKAQESEIVHYKARVHSLMKENNELKKQIKINERAIYSLNKKQPK
jgi:hypothetical protein